MVRHRAARREADRGDSGAGAGVGIRRGAAGARGGADRIPLIRTAPPPDGYAALDEAIGQIGEFSWVCFASAPAVRAFFERLTLDGRDARALAGVKVAAVGPATAEALRVRGVRADFQPREATGAALGDELPGEIGGRRILLPRAQEGEEALEGRLTERWARVTPATAYQTVLDATGAGSVSERLAEGSIDMVTFTSSSTVKNFATALNITLPAGVRVACIGPSTARTATERLGREPDVTAAEHTIPGLLAAIEGYYSG